MKQVTVSIVLDCLREFSDASYQKRVWNASSGPEVSSFSEAVCQLFDDSGLDVELDKGSTVFSSHLDLKLKSLRSKLSSIEKEMSPNEIINDPKMQAIRELSHEILSQMREEGFSE